MKSDSRHSCFMRNDIYNRLAEIAKKKNYSTYKYTNELISLALDIEEANISLEAIKDEIIMMGQLYKYKGRIIIVPFSVILNTTQSQWADLGRGLGLLIRQMVSNKKDLATLFISTVKFLFSLIGEISVLNNEVIISFPFYTLQIQNKLMESAKVLIESMINVSSISANISVQGGQIKIDLTNTI